MKHAIGSLVRVRERDWIVQPESSEDLLILKPLGGLEDETVGVLPSLEEVKSASFDLPDSGKAGDYLSCKLLRDAMLLGVRNGVGPFRSFGHMNLDPRPYQFVPLIMAMRLDPVRLMIADDVGVGKTIEAGMIAREMLDRGDIERMTVLCPPHLAEQWQRELNDKFHIDAELVLSNTAARLERNIGFGQSLFEVYPYTVVSLDYIKNDRRRTEFLRACPEFVIVDEVHTCSEDTGARGSRQLRWEMLRALSKNPDRHMLLLTATPHSGKEGNFSSLLTLLNDRFIHLPANLAGDENRRNREDLARHFVQRRRPDVQHYMREVLQQRDEMSPFPDREALDATWKLNLQYGSFLKEIIHWAKKAVRGYVSGSRNIQDRVKWWSALALMHTVSSSPAAAESTLLTRTETEEMDSLSQLEQMGVDTVMDAGEGDLLQGTDLTPDVIMNTLADTNDRKWFRQMAVKAAALYGDQDPKLLSLIPIIKRVLKDGFQPIVFCRYVRTAEYLEMELKARLKSEFKDIEIVAVSGKIAPEDREERIFDLGQYPCRILIATDCLSEGVNLQQYFNAVIHYDLAWNPTRHEQREGRVDRYGQPSRTVKTITYYGEDNPVDGIILKVLLRKHESIRKALGISVPIPVDGNALAAAIFESLLLQTDDDRYEQLALDVMLDQTIELERTWTQTAEQEKRSRAIFAQHTIKANEVSTLWEQSLNAVGSPAVLPFLELLCRTHAVPVGYKGNDILEIDFGALASRQAGFTDVTGLTSAVRLKSLLPAPEKTLHVTRTHPLVEALASHVFTDAFDEYGHLQARRCGVIRTKGISVRTVMILARARYLLEETKARRKVKEMMAEDVYILSRSGSGETAAWLDEERTEELLSVVPTGNVLQNEVVLHVERAKREVVKEVEYIRVHVHQRADRFMEQHRAVRESARMTGQTKVRVLEASEGFPVDIIGIFVILPEA